MLSFRRALFRPVFVNLIQDQVNPHALMKSPVRTRRWTLFTKRLVVVVLEDAGDTKRPKQLWSRTIVMECSSSYHINPAYILAYGHNEAVSKISYLFSKLVCPRFTVCCRRRRPTSIPWNHHRRDYHFRKPRTREDKAYSEDDG